MPSFAKDVNFNMDIVLETILIFKKLEHIIIITYSRHLRLVFKMNILVREISTKYKIIFIGN